uniref:Calcium-activated chloride channel regulator 1-like n=1 Tax=Terrapene triunguis TaxID=2587831 RepID=A0A674IQ24_9SAUR
AFFPKLELVSFYAFTYLMLLYVPLFPGKAKLLIDSTVQFLIHKAFLFFPYQAMVKEASTYLFNATKQRFFFKAVKIIIPLVNLNTVICLGLKSDPTVSPVWVQGSIQADLIAGLSKVFVHEWAHLRWGVFDEYNNDAPFYVSVNSGKASVEATRYQCFYILSSVDDILNIQSCTGNSCTTRECKSDEQTKLYEAGCKFVPEKTQNAPASIMYMQSLPSVVEFCDQSTHNEKATNLQNKMCSYHSTWEVIMNSMDFSNTSPINSASPPFETAFSLLQTKDRVVCLVLDVSGSMDGNNRIKRLKQAAEIFLLQIIETGSWVGIVTFHSTAQIETYLQQIINENVRRDLTKYLPISAGGGTNICAGVHKGFEVKENIGENYSNLYGSEIVLLTDGEDGGMSSCLTEVKNSGSIIHTIALGPNASPELEQFSNMTGGLRFYATDTVDSNGLIDAFSGISSGSGNISEQSIQLESTAQSVAVKQWMNGTVTVDSTVGNDTFFVVTWDRSTSPPDILLRDPKGKEYRTSNFTASNLNLQTARLNIAGTAEVGDWYYWIQNKHTDSQVISMIVTSRAASLAVPPVTVKALMNKDTNNFPNPMVIYAEVSQGFLPVLGATVMATVEPQTGSAVELKLLDDGSGADITKNDGVYSKYFTSFRGNGRYNLKVRVQGKDKTVRLRRRQSRALYVPGYIENGEIKMNAPRPEPSDDEIQAKLGSFNRVASGGSFVMENVPSGGTTDVFPPCKIIDLEAQYEEDKIHLSWTAPGNDFDVGQADRYIIKMSESLLDLRNTFEDATSVNTSSLVPKPAGTKESFQFKPENVTIENGTIIYFAIRAIDNASLTSEVSNIAQAALFIPPKESSPDSTPNDDVINEGINILTIVLIVAGSIIAVSIAVSMIVCILHKKNRRGGPELRM